MNWFSALFLCAALIALATGTAYFRGTIDRATEPVRYWSTVGCYLALALLMPALKLLK